MRFRRSLPFILAFILLSAGQQSSAHEGHDHDAAATPAASSALPRAEAASDTFELVAAARADEIVISIDRFQTNEPVQDATVTVETPQGSAEAEPIGDGTYHLPAAWVTTPGHYDLIATVVQGGAAEVLTFALEIPKASAGPTHPSEFDRIFPGGFYALFAVLAAFVLGGLLGLLAGRRRSAAAAILAAALVPLLASGAFAHEGHDHGPPQAAQPAGTGDTARILADGSVFVPKTTQRILAIRTIVSQPSVHRRTIELPGRIIPDPNASGFVQTAVGGRLSAPEGGFPRLGTRVKKGDVLAYVTPPLQAIDVSDMRQRQGELDQQISIVERRLARYQTLAPSGAVAQAQLEETRLELQGLRDRRSALDRATRAPEPLIAPVDGVIADGSPVAGQVAQTNQVIFQIIDPARLWVEALSYESLPETRSATARLGDNDLKLTFRGAGFADRNQSIPIHFAIDGEPSGVRVGQFVTVFAETADEQPGLALPRASIVRTTIGQDTVFEHVSAERFERRPVRIEPLDGQRVLILQGLAAGKRVVVQGAEMIDHIR